MNTTLRIVFIGLIVVSLFGGCASHSTPENTAALDAVLRDTGNTDNYKTVTILPFAVEADVNITDPKFGENFSAEIAARLRFDHPGLFQEVLWNKKRQAPGEAVVTGTIRKYKQGSRVARGLLIGLGTGSFEGEMVLKDAQDGKVLLSAPFDKLAVGGGLEHRSIENMVAETAVAIAKTIALWKQGQITR